MSFNSHNLSTVDPMSKTLGFSESLEKFVSNDVFQSKISLQPRTMGYNPWYGLIRNYFYLSNINFDGTILKGLFLSFLKFLKWFGLFQLL